MPTKNEIKQIEQICNQKFKDIDKLSIPTYIRQRECRNEASPEYPYGNSIEPYDIMREQEEIERLEQQERKLVEQAEIAREIDRENMKFLNAQFRL